MQGLQRLYCQKHEQRHYMSSLVFVDNQMSNGYMNRSSYIAKILGTQPREFLLPQALSLPTVFEMQLHFFALISLEECTRTKMVSTVRKYNSDMRMGYEVQVVMNA